jgi:hypothetical protein
LKDESGNARQVAYEDIADPAEFEPNASSFKPENAFWNSGEPAIHIMGNEYLPKALRSTENA